MSYGFPQIGNLCSLPRNELDRTNHCLKYILQQRQKDIEYRKDIEKEVHSLSEEKISLVQACQAYERKIGNA